MRNVLVTGGTGFVGSNLVHALLAEGCRVRVLHRPGSDLRGLEHADAERVLGDICDPVSVRRAIQGCDTVFHAAAVVSYWRRERPRMFAANIEGTRIVAEASLEAGVERFVHTSSIAALGAARDGTLSTEETPYNWGAFDVGYRTSKHEAELVVLAAVRRGLPAVLVNPAVILGPRDYRVRAGRIIRDVYRKRIFYATPGGTSIVDVDDVVRGHLAAARLGRLGERYILAGENLSFREIFGVTAEIVGGWAPRVVVPEPIVHTIAGTVEAVAGLFGREPWVTRELVSGIGVRRRYSTAKAERELGYTHRPFRETVARTFHWYRENGLL